MNARSWKSLFAALISALTLSALRGQTQFITNGGFESGLSGWTGVRTLIGSPGHSGASYARLGPSFYPDDLYQAVTIPANATAANLTFYYARVQRSIQSDSFTAYIAPGTGTLTPLQTLLTRTSAQLESTPGWLSSATYDLLAYRGQTIRIAFSYPGSPQPATFGIDDVSLLVTVPAATPILVATPDNTSIAATGGTASIAVSNSGGGTLNYSASSSQSWLTITSGGSGTNSGTIALSFAPNSGAERTATVTVAATGVTGSPATILYTQARAGAPLVTTGSASNFTSTSFTVSGEVTSDGGATVTERGFVYWPISGTPNTPNPTIDNRKIVAGAGTGPYSATFAGLGQGSAYFVRAYATSAVTTSYGTTITPVTLTNVPVASPADSRTTTSFRPHWTSVGGADSFGLDVSTTADFSTLLPGYADKRSATVLTTDVTGLTPGTTYYYRVRAYNSVGAPSGNSNTITASTLTTGKTQQTITFDVLVDSRYGAPPRTLTATATSGLPVTFRVTSGPATVSGNLLTITGAGYITVVASQAGNATYDVATEVDRTFSADGATLTVRADPKTKVYGDPNPPLTATYTGFVNGDTTASITTLPTLTTVATTSSPVGSYTIGFTGGAAANYTFNFISSSLTVERAPLTVIADDKAMLAGGTVPALTVSYSGLVNGDTRTAVQMPAPTTTATSSSPPGTYPIVPAGGSANNYTLTYSNGTLTVGTVATAPVFVSPASATFRLLGYNAVSIRATGAPAPTYTVAGLPPWANFNSQTGILGADFPPSIAVGTFTLNFTAANGTLPNATQTFTLTVAPAQVPPAFTSAPTATFTVGTAGSSTVVATGTPQPTLSVSQLPTWASLDPQTGILTGTPPAGAESTFTFFITADNGVGPAALQTFTLRVTGATQAPTIQNHPAERSVERGATLTFTVTADGTGPLTYVWTRDGTPVGTNSPILTISNAQPSDAGRYAVRVSNSVGAVTSNAATLTVTEAAQAPVIREHPVARTVERGATATFTVTAEGTSPLTYAWTRDGTPVGGNSPTLTIANAQPSDAGRYAVRVSNSAGAATSNAATLTVNSRAIGEFFGEFANGQGIWGLQLGTERGVFVAYLAAARTVVVQNLAVQPDGSFASTTPLLLAGEATQGPTGTPPVAAAAQSLTIAGNGSGSTVSGTCGNLSFSGPKDEPTGNAAGLYVASAIGANAGSLYVLRGSGSRSIAVWSTETTADGAAITSSSGTLTATTLNNARLDLRLDDQKLSGSLAAGGQTVNLAGLPSAVPSTSRLANLSVLARAAAGNDVIIVGFATSGSGQKGLLIRGVGPSLASFGLTGLLPDPRITLFDGAGNSLQSVSGWLPSMGPLFNRVGAFALGSNSADAALALPVSPGTQTVQLTSASGRSGLGLVELYDTDGEGAGAKLTNLSVRTRVPSGEPLILGFVISGNAPRTLVIRGVGPALAPFGVTGALSTPVLTVYGSGTTTLATNARWGGTAALNAAFARVGAFPLPAGSSDTALEITLLPGSYSAHLTGAAGSSGIGLLEIYDQP